MFGRTGLIRKTAGPALPGLNQEYGRFSFAFDMPVGIQYKIDACKELLKEHLLERIPLSSLGAFLLSAEGSSWTFMCSKNKTLH